jgi:hypothetical protein
MKPEGMEEHIYKQYQADGFTETDIERIWQDTLYFRERMTKDPNEREITSSTYERAQKRLANEVTTWFGKR